MSATGAGLSAVARCPACASPERSFLFASRDWIHELPGEFPLMRCAGCGCVYPDPRPSPDALGGYYPEDGYYAYAPPSPYRLFARTDPPARLWYAAARGILAAGYGYDRLGGSRALAATLGRIPPLHRRATFSLGVLLHPFRPGGALLDVGCGAGGYLDLMRALGWERVVGVDISEGAVATARDALGLEAYVGELADAAFPDDTFDAVTLSHTVEHVADPVALLAEVRRVTRPGGRVAIHVPNVDSMLSRRLGEHWLGLETPRHLVNFSPTGMRTVLDRAGLRIESVRTVAQGSYGVALFSTSRARGDPHSAYTDDRHRYPLRRRAEAAALATAEAALCRLDRPAGELIAAVARA